VYVKVILRAMENEKVLKLIHDLNNILCACSGFTDMLLDVEDREHQKKLLSISRKGINRMGELLEDTRKELIKEVQRELITGHPPQKSQ
jgi:signal transduction histidine kinase